MQKQEQQQVEGVQVVLVLNLPLLLCLPAGVAGCQV